MTAKAAGTGNTPEANIVRAQLATERRGFLMTKVAADSTYWARYVDGFTEKIDPITGVPRPDPDLATRTKKYVVPGNLTASASTRTRASQYSGLMRMAVGCFHSRGKNSPFSYTFAKTHGIVKKMVAGTAKYWVVEIAAAGCYAAPIPFKGKCSNSFNVNAYLQTLDSALDLAWAFTNKPDAGVISLGTPGTAYTHNPWFARCGWAFSYSGHEAQIVTQRKLLTPTPHFLCDRWKLEFALAGESLSMTATKVEADKAFTTIPNSLLWWPDTVAGTWNAAVAEGTFSFGNQDAPIHVYYDGDTEVISRWKYEKATISGTNTPSDIVFTDIDGAGRTLTYHHSKHYVQRTGAMISPVCQEADGEVENTSETTAANGVSTSTRDSVSVGFYSPLADATPDGDPVATTTYADELNSTPADNITNSDPEWTPHASCGGGGPVTNNVNEGFRDRRLYLSTIHNLSNSFVQKASAVLFAEEREACLMVYSKRHTQAVNLRRTKVALVQEFSTQVSEKVSGAGPWTDWERAYGLQPLDLNALLVGDFDTLEDTSTPTDSGEALLQLGGVVYPVTLTFDGSGLVTNTGLATFLSYTAGVKETAASEVKAMHGNIYDVQSDLTPTDQKNNSARTLNGASTFVGGFEAMTPPVDAVAFVGRA